MEYFVARTVEEATGLLRSHENSRPVAGGTDVAVILADVPEYAQALVDIAGIPRLQGIRTLEGGISIGSATRIAEIASRTDLPACLLRGARSIGSPQIRNLATIGGNVCNASPCGDTLAPLIALDALFVLESGKGTRELRAEEFFVGPKKTLLRPGEILTEIRIDARHLGGASAFCMIGKRNGQAISQVNAAIWLIEEEGGIADFRAAIGSVAPIPLRLARTEAVLRGRKAGELAMPEILAAVDAEISPISDVRAGVEYRRILSGTLFRECLDEALAYAAGNAAAAKNSAAEDRGQP
jgi:CO/xanthine dehydrogenase FAD-binding subunit